VLKAGSSHATARLIVDDEYYGVARALIAQARRACLASIFIVDLKAGQLDRDARVFQLLKLLREASWRGVQVRLLLGGSRSNLLIAEAAEVARYVSLELGIPCRWLTSQDVRGSHSKFIISDSRVLTGSHNWSAPAFTDQTQDSLLLESAALAAYLTAYFNRQWNRAEWRA
jgi:phosphatidylserine/phosphatidylglycerophosphate/cardiolipin synthase-like enzyme